LSGVEFESLLQAIERSELDIAEALWLALNLVLDNAYITNFAASKEVFDVQAPSVKWQVAKMCGIWGLGR
jgi:hypothetical protein